MTDQLSLLLEQHGICIGEPEERAALARRISGFGITTKELQDALWYMGYTGLKNVDAQVRKLAKAGMESLQDYCKCAAKVRQQKDKPEPGASEREENMERRAKVMSGRTFEEKLAAGIPIEQWTEAERQRYEWHQQDEAAREEYAKKFGDGPHGVQKRW